MYWCKQELPKVEQCINKKCARRDGDVLLRTNAIKDELHTRVPLLLKTKRTSIVPPYTKSMGSSARICVPFTDVVQKMHFHIQQQHVMYRTFNNYRAARLCSRENFRDSGSQAFQLRCPGLRDLHGRPNKIFRNFGLLNILAGVPGLQVGRSNLSCQLIIKN